MTAMSIPSDAEEADDVITKAQRQREAKRAVDDAADEMRGTLDKGIVLGGRTWKPPRALTFEAAKLRLDVVRRSGIAGLFPQFNRATGDSDALTALVLQTAFANGALFDLLAHLLVEDGAEIVPWSQAAAAERATFFSRLVDPEDHARLEANLLMLVLDFFLRASASTPISLRSTVLAGIASARALGTAGRITDLISSPPNTSDATDARSFAATSTSATGTPSSEPSHDSEAPTP